jgi:hypothetical protein
MGQFVGKQKCIVLVIAVCWFVDYVLIVCDDMWCGREEWDSAEWAAVTVWTNLKWHPLPQLVFSLNACEISLSELYQGSLQGDIDPLLRGALRRVQAHHEGGGLGGDDDDDSNSDHVTLQQQVTLLKKQLQEYVTNVCECDISVC